MKNKNGGFTIIELLAVIVILAIILVIAGSSVLNAINNSKRKMASDVRNNLKETALTYGLDHLYLEKCSPTFSNEIVNNNIKNLNANENCIKRITVEELKKEGLFEDKRGFCKNNDYAIVYRYFDGVNSEYKAYVSDNACNN